MKKRGLTISIAAICLLLLAGLVWLAVFSKRSPVYQGHSLNYWLGEVFTTNQAQAMQVMRNLPPEAAPEMVRVFERTDTGWSKTYAKWYPKLPVSWRKHFDRPMPAQQAWNAALTTLLNNQKLARAAIPGILRLLDDNRNHAHLPLIYAIQLAIGPQDSNCVPILIRCLQDRETRIAHGVVVGCLGHIGPAASNAVPAIAPILADADVSLRVQAAEALWKIDRETNAIAVLKRVMNDGNNRTDDRFYAANFLSEAVPDDLSPIPVLIEELKSTNEVAPLNALFSLQNYGQAAKPAVPTLIEFLKNGNPAYRKNAVSTLKIIDPEEAKKYEQH